MGKTIGVYITDIEDALLEAEIMRRRAFPTEQKGCDSVAKLIRACVRLSLMNKDLNHATLEGT